MGIASYLGVAGLSADVRQRDKRDQGKVRAREVHLALIAASEIKKFPKGCSLEEFINHLHKVSDREGGTIGNEGMIAYSTAQMSGDIVQTYSTKEGRTWVMPPGTKRGRPRISKATPPKTALAVTVKQIADERVNGRGRRSFNLILYEALEELYLLDEIKLNHGSAIVSKPLLFEAIRKEKCQNPDRAVEVSSRVGLVTQIAPGMFGVCEELINSFVANETNEEKED